MYAPYWGLVESPFQGKLDLRFFHESAGHEEALARLEYLVQHHRRGAVLSGSAGVGKSLLVQVLSAEVSRTQRATVLVDAFGKSASEVLWDVVAGLGLGPSTRATTRELWRQVQDHLQGNQLARLPSVLVFDHLDQAGADAVTAVQRLFHISSTSGIGATLVICTRSENVSTLSELFATISDLRIELPPLEAAQTKLYIGDLLAKAGARRQIFEPVALEQIHDLTQGIPRDINRLCDLSLLAAMSDRESIVTDDIVTSAAEQLNLTRLDVNLDIDINEPAWSHNFE